MEKNKIQKIKNISEIIKFQAYEYTSEEKFISSNFSIKKTIDDESNTNTTGNFLIERNNLPYLHLPDGYMVLKTLLCGICSTDLNRKYLPFPLPQVLGHEIIAKSLDKNLDNTSYYVVEISDSCSAHKSQNSEIFCESNLTQHCPNRYVLGINMLLGGFSPYIIVPVNSAIKYNQEIIPDFSAVLVEPLAAAFNAIYTSRLDDDYSIAVIGPKKLGALIIAGLNAYRKRKNLRIKITAVIRREALREFCYKMGADFVVNSKDENFEKIKIFENFENFEKFENFTQKSFDVVFDTSGSESGFKLALNLAKREVHLKSTSGQKMCGLNNLTAMVVDEINLRKFDFDNFKENFSNFQNKTKNDDKTVIVIYVSPTIQDEQFCKFLSTLIEEEGNVIIYSEKSLDQIDESIFTEKNNYIFKNRLPRFDLCIVNGNNLNEVDKVIRPFENSEISLIKPKGNIFLHFYQEKDNSHNYNNLQNFLMSNGIITTSRCGDFRLTLDYLESDEILRQDIQNMITHVLPIEKIEEGFKLAKSEDAIKVILKHE
jgi:threonine dehydrogenase-like Zn-dependent dehydrogenase